jgi:signal transduction histidine kinase
MQDVIFEKFRQIDSSHTREHPGTGLGLAICKELAEMLGATVSFVSKPGHGATFYVDLPMTHQPDEPQPLMA